MIEAVKLLMGISEGEELEADAEAGRLGAVEEAGTSEGKTSNNLSEFEPSAEEEAGLSEGETSNDLSESQLGAADEAGTSGGGGEGGEASNNPLPPPIVIDWDERRRQERKETNRRIAQRYGEFYARFDPDDPEGHAYFSRRNYLGQIQDPTIWNQYPPTDTSIDAQLPLWRPSNASSSFRHRSPPSLLDLCMPILAANVASIQSLDGIPDFLKSQLSAAICGRRKMDSKALSLFFQGQPSEIQIHDCSLVSEEELTRILAKLYPFHLEKLHLGLCGRPISEQCLIATLARPRNFVPLKSVSLSGAYRLNDKGLIALVRAATRLICLDLSYCSSLTDAGIRTAVYYVWTDLKMLVLDNCSQLDAKNFSSSLVKLKKLQKLSLASINGMNDKVVDELVEQLGPHLQELCLASCR